MLSYRHAFHAGNHADVLKHVVLLALLAELTRKEKPLWVIDTHAGAGIYALGRGPAARLAEFETGIGRLWSREALPDAIAAYVREVRVQNADGALRHYPGSPQLAFQAMRTQDRLRLFERHPADAQALQAWFRGNGRRVSVVAGDGFAGLRAVLPPPSRRGLVLVDPSYETVADYRAVPAAIRDALRRFATGVYAVWYPQIPRREAVALPDQLHRLAPGDWLHAWLRVRAPAGEGFGLHGSGVFVFNPPYGLEAALRAAMPVLAEALAQDRHAAFELTFRQT